MNKKMKIKKIEVFPGDVTSHPRSPRTDNSYPNFSCSKGRVVIHSTEGTQTYKFPFYSARFLRIEDKNSWKIRKQDILLLYTPLIWDTIVPKGMTHWPPNEEDLQEGKFRGMSKEELDRYVSSSDLYLTRIDETIRNGRPKVCSPYSQRDLKLHKSIIEKITSGMRKRFGGLCDLIRETDLVVEFNNELPISLYVGTRDQSILVIYGNQRQLYDIDVRIENRSLSYGMVLI